MLKMTIDPGILLKTSYIKKVKLIDPGKLLKKKRFYFLDLTYLK